MKLMSGWTRPGFGDVVLFPFLLVFVRQYFWFLDHQILAWALSVLATALLWALVLRFKDAEETTPLQFWLIVATPLLLIYGMRFALPDTSYDVLNYRIVSAERALHGWPFIVGDFFPPFYPLNPAPDMLFGIFRHTLGYRLGPILNLIILLWTGTILNRMLRPHVRNNWLRAVAVLLVLWTEQTFFLINTYLIDLLALPLLLQATYVSILPIESDRQAQRRLLLLALLLGLSAALKILNLAYAIPITFVYLLTLFRYKDSVQWTRLVSLVPIAVLVALFPLLPYSLYMYQKSGNPIFPMYNAIFKSVYWPTVNLYDGRWGPRGLIEALVWPLRVAFDSSRTGELLVYSGRISIACIAAILSLAISWRVFQLRALNFAVLLGSLLWAINLTGYARYAIFVELIGGVVIVGLMAQLLQRQQNVINVQAVPTVAGILLAAACIFQLSRATQYFVSSEWSQRPTIFVALQQHKADARFILRDYRLEVFLNESERRELGDVGVWIESGPLTSGFQSLLKPDAPILCAYIHDFFYSKEGREAFDRSLQQSSGKRIASLCSKDDLASCTEVLARRGLQIVEQHPITIFVYSKRTSLQMYLLKLEISS